jgi:hypothetical protein
MDLVEKIAAVLFDHKFNGQFGGGVAARMLFGKDRITYAEVLKGVEDGTYAESSLSDARNEACAVLSCIEEEGYVVVPRDKPPTPIHYWP